MVAQLPKQTQERVMAEFDMTDTEITVLKAARAILKDLESRCLDATTSSEESINLNYNLGKLSEACDQAENSVFNVLNVAKSYLNTEVGDL
jgi:hypothetical protein